MLSTRKPPITDLTAVHALYECACQLQELQYPPPLTAGPDANNLWSNAAKQCGNPIAANELRLRQAMSHQRWQDANSAVMELKRQSPKKRAWLYALIALQQLVGEVAKDEETAGRHLELAARMLKLASVENRAEAVLIMQVLRRQGKDERITDFNIGAFIPERSMIDALIKTKRWNELSIRCSFLLEKETHDEEGKRLSFSHRDDWSVWNGYLQACIGTGKTFEIAPLLAEAVAEGVRPAKLALIGLHLHAESQDEASNFTNTLDAMQAYFDAYQDQTFCFTDIRDFVVQLPTTAQADLRRRIEQSVRSIKAEQDALLSKSHYWMRSEINAQKLEYLLTIGNTRAHPDYVTAFVKNCLRLLRAGNDSVRHAAVDACYLTVSALIRLTLTNPQLPHLLQAACLLEHAGGDTFQAKVMLVYLYTELGFHTLAAQQYESLSVKEIQQETVSHVLFTRISVNHPFSFSKKGKTSADPFDMLSKSLENFERMESKLAETQYEYLKSGQSDLFFELQELRWQLEHSVTRRIQMLERRRIARLTDRTSPDVVHPSWCHCASAWYKDTRDGRDFNMSFDFGCNSVVQGQGVDHGWASTETLVHQGAIIPGASWLVTNLLADITWTVLADGKEPAHGSETYNVVKGILTEEKPERDMLPMEKTLRTRWVCLFEATCLVNNLQLTQEVVNPEKLSSSLDALQNSIKELPISVFLDRDLCREEFRTPPWSWYMRSYFLLFDFLKAAWLFCNIAVDINKNRRKGNRVGQPGIDVLRREIKQHWDALQAQATKEEKDVVVGRTFDILTGGEVGAALLDLNKTDELGTSWLQSFVDRVTDSARDAWQGVTRVKLGPTKQ